jgi:serine/threonine protein kinase
MASDIPKYLDSTLYTQLLELGYKVTAKLGQGISGDVFRVEKNGIQYAIKVFEYSMDMENSLFLSDINYSLMFKHPYICNSHEFIKTENYMGILMDEADIDLKTYMENRNLGYIEKIKFMYQIASALDYLSSLGRVHCDLKPNNILLKNRNIVLADFGLTRIKEYIDPDYCQTYCYRAPELIFNRSPSDEYSDLFNREKRIRWLHNQLSSEMWSFGLLCLDIIYDKPFLNWYGSSKYSIPRENAYDDLLNKLCEKYNEESVYDTIVSFYSTPENPDLLRVISNMFLSINQDRRIKSYREFLDHPMFELIHIHELSYLPQMPEINTYTEIITNKENVYTQEMLSITVEWMFDVADEFCLPPYVIFNAVDFFLQKVYTYVHVKRDIQLFSTACLWINSRLHLSSEHSLIDYSFISDHAYTIEEIYNKILEIIGMEKGRFVFNGIYKYLPDRGSLYVAKEVMCRVKKYAEYGPSKMALAILERSNKIKDKFPKTHFKLYVHRK